MPHEDMYEDGEETNTPEDAEGKTEAAASETGLLPKGFFQGKDLSPGNRCEIEIVKAYDDQVEVKYVPHQKDKGKADVAVVVADDDMLED